jgi:hypothetical protein
MSAYPQRPDRRCCISEDATGCVTPTLPPPSIMGLPSRLCRQRSGMLTEIELQKCRKYARFELLLAVSNVVLSRKDRELKSKVSSFLQISCP